MKKLLLSVIAVCAAIASVAAQESTLKPEQKLRYAERIIESYYVDPVDGEIK